MDTDQDFQLLDFAEEILMNIFSFFDDCTLIKSTKVCRRFKTIAKVAVQDKYNGKGNHQRNYYQLKEYADDADDQRIQHEPFFGTFANQIKAVQISFFHRDVQIDNWMVGLIMEYCPNVLKLIVGQTVHRAMQPSYKWTVSYLEQIISWLPQLRFLQLNNINLNNSRWSENSCQSLSEIVFNHVDILDLQTLQNFLGHNRQLESFKFNGLNHIKFAAFNGSNLREFIQERPLHILVRSVPGSTFLEDSPHVQMEKLKKISVGNSYIDLFEKLAAGCENIESLTVFAMTDYIEITGNQLDAFLSLKQISSLNLNGVRLSADQLKKLITQSPNLIEFECTCADEIPIDNVKDIVLHAKNHCKMVEMRLSSTFKNMKPSKLGIEFHNWFKNNAKSNLQLVLLVKSHSLGWVADKFTVTKEKITRNGVLVLWNDYEQSSNDSGQSKVDLLQLNDKCFEKIIRYLKQFEKLALYQTCSRMQKLIEPMFQQEYAANTFPLRCDSPMTEYFVRYFGKYMTNITFGSDRKCDNIDDRCTFHWELIHKYCNAALANLTVEHSPISPHISYMDQNQILFPNLKKLKFIVPINHLTVTTNYDDTDLIYSFCPNLQHLQFGSGMAMLNRIDMDFDFWLSNLTTLRIENYNPVWFDLLLELNDTAHRSLQNLTLQNLCDAANGRLHNQLDNAVINEIVRFPNLKSLDLLLSGNHNVNTKFLFESCSKLEILSIIMGSFIPYRIFGNIKKICNKLETLKIVVKRSPSVTGLLYLDEVRKYFPSQLLIKVYEADDRGYLTEGFILDKGWLANYKKFRSSVHD